MSNLYGYSDYNGPNRVDCVSSGVEEEQLTQQGKDTHHYHTPYQTDEEDGFEYSEDEDDINPLQAGLWTDGDSLAPPCGTTVSTIHRVLDMVLGDTMDVDCCLYDLGCGDGRVCLEAYAKYHCPCTIGVEIEPDLVERARYLTSKLPATPPLIPETEKKNNDSSSPKQLLPPKILQMDLRHVINQLLAQVDKKSELATISNELGLDARYSQEETIEDLPLPTIIFLFLMPEALSAIEPQLIQLLKCIPKLQIVCSTWSLRIPVYNKTDVVEENGAVTQVFFYKSDV